MKIKFDYNKIAEGVGCAGELLKDTFVFEDADVPVMELLMAKYGKIDLHEFLSGVFSVYLTKSAQQFEEMMGIND